MRWKYIDPKNKTEAAERQALLHQIDSWWQAFQLRTSDISALFSNKKQWDLPGWMEEHLQSIDPHLMWEYGPAVKGDGHRLVITPEIRHDLRPLVEVILQRAPQIPSWEFYPYRLPEGLEQVMLTVKGRTGVDIADFQFRATRNEFHQVNLTCTSPQITQAEDNDATDAAFVAIESILGEECLNHWIGAIEAIPLPREKGLMGLLGKKSVKPAEFYPLSRLKDTVDAVIGSIRDQLPDRPHSQWVQQDETANQVWTLFELQPEETEDYPHQLDMFVGKSVNSPLWRTAHEGTLFHSERFTRCGETFLYLKVDGAEGLGQDGFADKAEIEDALDEVLRPAMLGCHIGGGTGMRYSYIDLAVTDLERAIPLIQQRLRAGKIPLRSWLLFFENAMFAEWIGIYDDTPPPPMPVEEDES